MIYLLLFLTLSAFAAPNSNDVYDKSFPRDNTFCSHKGKRVEILIRAGNKFTEPSERGYGEYLFYRRPNKKAVLLKLNEFRADTYKLFKGTGPFCSKSFGFKTDSSTMALLLLKENQPFLDKLVLQLFDSNTMAPKGFIETNYLVDKVKSTKNGFSFRTITENYNPEIGRIAIEGTDYIFQEKSFPQWVEYSAQIFELKSDLTFKNLPWNKFFKDKDDFLELAGWDEKEKVFKKNILYLAVSHKLKRQCLLFIEKKQKLAGNEAWRCHKI